MTTAIRQPMSPTLAQAGGAPPPAPDSWLDALSKLVPGEVIVAFTAALQLPSIGDQLTPHLAILILFAALVPAALWRSARRAGTAAPLLQYVVRTAMFVLYGLGTDSFLAQQLNDLRLSWIPGVVGIALALFAALVLSPPGAAAPPPARA